MTNEKIHTIDGVKYREVERKVEVGEKIVTVSYTGTGANPGDVLTVDSVHYSGDGSVGCGGKAFFDTGIGDEYRVLEPITDADPTSPTLLDLIAKLTTKVMALESEVAELRGLSESNSEDIALLDGRTQVLNAVERFYAKGGTSL